MMEEEYRCCRLCPANCGADRISGKYGACGMGAAVTAARAALHFWEEPCISGKEGSGTVFFSGCPLGCVFCQNREISKMHAGKTISTERLAEIFLELQGQKANNINLVTAVHFVPSVVNALETAKARGLIIPVVYNSSGYESVRTLKMLEGLVDVWLPDFKYFDAEPAARYSRRADYPERAKEALAEMVRQAGAPVFDEQGMMKRGVIVRHLLLPGQTGNAKRVIRYLHETYGNEIWISIMNQYTPMSGIGERWPELDRQCSPEEYERVLDFAARIGVENGFRQEGGTIGESFIPAFDLQGI
ncbi:MAG: radical SAM protein [Lachnospiraceae bacterium]|nr:radical SAM protein [Lachnospiraceae bacterium]